MAVKKRKKKKGLAFSQFNSHSHFQLRLRIKFCEVGAGKNNPTMHYNTSEVCFVCKEGRTCFI